MGNWLTTIIVDRLLEGEPSDERLDDLPGGYDFDTSKFVSDYFSSNLGSAMPFRKVIEVDGKKVIEWSKEFNWSGLLAVRIYVQYYVSEDRWIVDFKTRFLDTEYPTVWRSQLDHIRVYVGQAPHYTPEQTKNRVVQGLRWFIHELTTKMRDVGYETLPSSEFRKRAGQIIFYLISELSRSLQNNLPLPDDPEPPNLWIKPKSD